MAPKAKAGEYCDLTQQRGITMYYEMSGPPVQKKWREENEALLFVLLGSAADLRKQSDQQYVNQAVPYFRVLAFDHRNTGRTTRKDEPCTMEDYADDAAALLQAVVPDKLPVYVLGISFGGMVAQHLALRHPHLIKKLVLCCCATGGEGGMSYPIHEWYEPGISVEDRVKRRIFQANTDRTPEWQEKSANEWNLVRTLLLRDEKVDEGESLRTEGVMRQLEARKGHNTWDSIGQLQMDVLCLASGKDNITQPALVKTLAERIGSNAEMKLDFDWGHPFIAADLAAMAYVNEWLRKPLKARPAPPPGAAAGAAAAASAGTASSPAGGVWEVVGGADKGGIIVRDGVETSSTQQAERVSTGALVEELELQGERLHYRLLQGTGPREGWVSISLKGKELAVRTEKRPS